jgi:hypothetical protein
MAEPQSQSRGLVLGPRALVRAAVLLAVMLGLGWLCLAQGLTGHFLATREVAPALSWAPNDGQALSLKAETLSGRGEFSRAAATARRALQADPSDVSALRVLGNAEAVTGDRARARIYFRRGAALSRRDTPTQYWLFADAAGQGDFKAAMRSADSIMRRTESGMQAVGPAVAGLMGDPRAVEALVDRMALAPDWRPKLMSRMGAYASVDGFRQLLFEMKARGLAPTDPEVGDYVNRVMKIGEFAQARADWFSLVSTKPPTTGQWVYDPGFDGLRGPPPFNWQLFQDPGVTATLEAGPTGGELVLRYDGFDPHSGMVRQTLALPPGRYRLTGRVRVNEDGADGLYQWLVRCIEGRPLALGEPIDTEKGQWARFHVDFDVDEACAAQSLYLNARGGDRRLSLETSFDDIEVRQAPVGVGGPS